jgi:serine/threonine protein kinase
MPDIQSVRQQAAQSVDALRQLMQSLGLDDSVNIWHEFVPHASANLQTIQAAAEAVDRMPKSDKEYFEYAVTVGAGLSSIGQLEEAERFLVEARKKAPNADARAFAGNNLFYVRLRLQKYDDALDVLMTAIRHDPKKYSLHDAQKYRPIKILGAGGLGVVFQCENPDGGRPVVVKALWEPAAAGDGVFEDIQRLAQVPHDSILLPKDMGWSDAEKSAHPYFVYDRIPGITTGEEWLAQHGKMEPDQVMALGAKILDALAVAHGAGVAHYDLKPANLYFKQAGNDLQVWIADFGQSRAGISLRQRALQNPDPAGKGPIGQKAIATIDYAAPEVLSGGAAGYHSDLYSFASTMYRFFTGEAPKETSGTALPNIAGLYQLLLTCREEDPAKRPPTVTGLAQWWADPSQGPEAAGIHTGIGTSGVTDPVTGAAADGPVGVDEGAGKSKVGLIVGIVAAVVVLGGLGAYFALGGEEKKQTEKEDKGPKVKPLVSEKEAARIKSWYKQARGKAYGFLSGPCKAWHSAGYKYESHLVPETKTKKIRGRMRDYTVFELQLKPSSSGAPAGKLNIFECPVRAAQIHRDHPIKLWLKIKFFRANMFSRAQRIGTLKISGKLLGYLDKKTYRGGVVHQRVFAIPALRKADDPGIAAFGRGKPFRFSKKGLKIANLFFERLGKGRGILGRYETTLKTDTKFKQQINDWATGCKGLTEGLKNAKPGVLPKYEKHKQYHAAAVDWTKGFCAALTKLNQSVEPYAESGVNEASKMLLEARANWNKNIHAPVKKLIGSVKLELGTPPL